MPTGRPAPRAADSRGCRRRRAGRRRAGRGSRRRAGGSDSRTSSVNLRRVLAQLLAIVRDRLVQLGDLLGEVRLHDRRLLTGARAVVGDLTLVIARIPSSWVRRPRSDEPYRSRRATVATSPTTCRSRRPKSLPIDIASTRRVPPTSSGVSKFSALCPSTAQSMPGAACRIFRASSYGPACTSAITIRAPRACSATTSSRAAAHRSRASRRHAFQRSASSGSARTSRRRRS